MTLKPVFSETLMPRPPFRYMVCILYVKFEIWLKMNQIGNLTPNSKKREKRLFSKTVFMKSEFRAVDIRGQHRDRDYTGLLFPLMIFGNHPGTWIDLWAPRSRSSPVIFFEKISIIWNIISFKISFLHLSTNRVMSCISGIAIVEFFVSGSLGVFQVALITYFWNNLLSDLI